MGRFHFSFMLTLLERALDYNNFEFDHKDAHQSAHARGATCAERRKRSSGCARGYVDSACS